MNQRPSPAFYRSIHSEIEEIGWQHLVKANNDLSSLSFRVSDENGRLHTLDIMLPPNYPKCAPTVASGVPYICEVSWSWSSRLKDVAQQFSEHLQKLQEFWSIMDDIDRNLLVVHPKLPSLATTYRQISIGNQISILLHINAFNPGSVPECRFLGSDSSVDLMRKNWKRNSTKWKDNQLFHKNLATVLEVELPGPPSVSCQKDNEQVECGICYAQHLPVDDELGASSGSATDYNCENPNCSKAFHTVCLKDWLRSITTTRQSFNVLFGNCPYCSDPVAVKLVIPNSALISLAYLSAKRDECKEYM